VVGLFLRVQDVSAVDLTNVEIVTSIDLGNVQLVANGRRQTGRGL
jgi:hypothetical protein